MANRSFVVKQIENIKTEADWTADESYQILPNEEVLAVCNKTVGEGESAQNYVYIRSKVNTTTTPKLFKELKYSDEYIEVQIENAVGNLSTTVNAQLQNLNSRVGDVETVSTGLRNDLNDVAGQVEETNATVTSINSKVTKNTTDITNLTTTVEGNTTNITKNTQDIAANTTAISNLSTSVEEQINTKIASAYKASGSVADVASLPTASATTLGNVYNMTADFTTTDAFIDGAGKKFTAGTNVAVVEKTPAVMGDDGTVTTPATYGYDVLSGLVDLTAYSTTEQMNTAISTATSGVSTDLTSLTTRVTTAEESLNGLDADIQNMETQLANKADTSALSSYLTTTDASSTYAPKASPALTGNPTAPTQTAGNNSTRIATTAFVQTALSNVSGGNKIVLSSSTPSGMSSGDLWMKII